MAWTDILVSWLNEGKAGSTTLFNAIKGNLDYLKGNVGTSNIGNLCPNPSFELEDSGVPQDWIHADDFVVTSSNNSAAGAKYLAVTTDTSGAQQFIYSPFMEISHKKLLRWKAKFFGASGMSYKIIINFYKGDQSNASSADTDGSGYPQPGELPENAYGGISTSTVNWVLDSLIPASVAGQWHSVQGCVQPPADARYCSIYVCFNGNGSALSGGADDVEVYQPDFDDRDYITASDTLQLSLDAEKSTNSTSVYVEAKRFRVYQHGIYRVKFDFKSGLTINSYAQIYKNGIPYGTLRATLSTSYTTYSEDLEFGQGDTIELWIKSAHVSYPCYTQNFRLYFDEAKAYGYGKDIL